MLRGTYGENRHAFQIWIKLDVIWHIQRKQQCNEAHMEGTATQCGTCSEKTVMRHTWTEVQCDEVYMETNVMS
jgi:hypothetical protein